MRTSYNYVYILAKISQKLDERQMREKLSVAAYSQRQFACRTVSPLRIARNQNDKITLRIIAKRAVFRSGDCNTSKVTVSSKRNTRSDLITFQNTLSVSDECDRPDIEDQLC